MRPNAPMLAAALGAATGLRSLSGLAALTLASRRRGRRPSEAVRFLARADVGPWVRGAALLEIAADKFAPLPPRTDPLPFAGRVLLGAAAGTLVADLQGSSRTLPAAVGSLAAAVTAVAGTRVRARVTSAGTPDPIVALIEDGCAAALAFWAIRRL